MISMSLSVCPPPPGKVNVLFRPSNALSSCHNTKKTSCMDFWPHFPFPPFPFPAHVNILLSFTHESVLFSCWYWEKRERERERARERERTLYDRSINTDRASGRKENIATSVQKTVYELGSISHSRRKELADIRMCTYIVDGKVH